MTWAPRESVAIRLGHDGPVTPGTAAGASASRFHSRFPRLLAEETRTRLARLSGELGALDLPDGVSLALAVDEKDWELAGAATRDDNGAVRLSISLGLAMAVEEATLEFVAHGDAICPVAVFDVAREQGDSLPFELHIFCYSTRRLGGLHSYAALKGRRFQAGQVTRSFPVDLWRLRQQELLSDLVLRWIALHEVAHAALQHNSVLDRMFGAGRHAGLAEVESASPEGTSNGDSRPLSIDAEESAVRRVLELHADTCALWLAFDLTRQSAATSADLFDHYSRDMETMGCDPRYVFTRLTPDTQVHFQLLAALIAIMLLENCRRRRGLETGSTHPSPEARLISLLRAAPYGSALAQANGIGEFEIRVPAGDVYPDQGSSPWTRFLQDGLARAVEDMEFFSDVIGLDFALMRPGSPPLEIDIERTDDGYFKPVADLDDSGTSGWWQDVLSWNRLSLTTLAGEPEARAAASAGGRELEQLDPWQQNLNALSEDLQDEAGGRLLFLLERETDA